MTDKLAAARSEHHEAPPHLHDGPFVCRVWHLTARTPAGRLVSITTHADPDWLWLPDGWVLVGSDRDA